MQTLSSAKIQRAQSVTATVYDRLREDIVSGALPPGTRLLEAQLSAAMGVSRSPIREALRQLEADGLVESRAHSGAYVRELSADQVWEVYTARSLLEGYAASLAAERAGPEDIERLRAMLAATLDAAERRAYAETIEADFGLHRQIWLLSGHRIINDILSRLEVQIRMYLAVQISVFEDFFDREMMRSHGPVIDAIARGDGESARTLMEQHIALGASKTLSYLRSEAGGQRSEAQG
jgi:DNA-binding GntR family transcriptional regulator